MLTVISRRSLTAVFALTCVACDKPSSEAPDPSVTSDQPAPTAAWSKSRTMDYPAHGARLEVRPKTPAALDALRKKARETLEAQMMMKKMMREAMEEAGE